MPRSSARLASHALPPSSLSLPPYYTPPLLTTPLLTLSPELLDQILSFLLLPHSTPLLRRQLAHSLLGVCRALTPLVRRRVFSKVGLTISDPKGRDLKLLSILTSHPNVGSCVKSLRIRAPTPPEPLHADITFGGPGAALVPETSLDQVEVVRRVTGVLEACEEVREVEIETRVGMRVEHAPCGEKEEEAGLDELERVLSRLKGVRKLGIAVAHARLKLQVLAQPSSSSLEEQEPLGLGLGFISPFLPSLSLWSSLTHLDLWRILLHFPPSSFVPPTPTFSLVEAQIQSSSLGGVRELLWLFGRPEQKRGSKLQKLLIRDVEFVETPESAEPLLAIFPCAGPAEAEDEDEDQQPAFHASLDSLVLILPHPILPHSSTNDRRRRLTDFLSSLTSLRHLELGGPGLTLPILSSLFSPSGPAAPPAQKIETLHLSYTPSLPIVSLLTLLRAHLLTSSSADERMPSLRTLDILRAGSHPRTWSWSRISSTPTPVWEWTPSQWRQLEKLIRSLSDSRRRRRRASTPSSLVPIRLCRDGTEVDIDYDSQAEDEEEESEEEEEETDGEALFEPSSEPAEGGEVQVWGREESAESDW